MSTSAAVDPREREVLDHPFPEDPVDYFRQHGYSGRKGFYSPDEAIALGSRVWQLHEAMQATLPPDTPAIQRSMPWPVSAIPDDLVADLRLADLTDLGPCVAFWIPMTHVPMRTGLVALADVDGSGLRPARQADLDPGDLTWHNMTVVHRAEDCPVDFLAFGIAMAGSQARIDLGDWPQLRGMRGQLCRRISPDLRHRGSVVTDATPPLVSLSR